MKQLVIEYERKRLKQIADASASISQLHLENESLRSLLTLSKESTSAVEQCLQERNREIREQEESDHSLSRSLSDLKDMLLPAEGV